MSSVARSEAYRDLMLLLALVPAWDADKFRDALARFEEAIHEEHREERRTLDRLIADQTVKEARIRRVANQWAFLTLPEDRERKIPSEMLSQVGEFLLMVLDHPEVAEELTPEALPYVVEDLDDSCVASVSGECAWMLQGFRSCDELEKPCLKRGKDATDS